MLARRRNRRFHSATMSTASPKGTVASSHAKATASAKCAATDEILGKSLQANHTSTKPEGNTPVQEHMKVRTAKPGNNQVKPVLQCLSNLSEIVISP